jgi:Metal-dependent hydrolase
VVNVFLLIITLISKSKSALIPIIALIPSLLYTNSFVQLWGSDDVEEGDKIVVESYNVGLFSSGSNKMPREECLTKMKEHFKTVNPDIICLQEFFVTSTKQADTIFKQYPHRFYHLFKISTYSYFGNIILSKFPIVNSGEITFPKSTNHCIFADINYKNSVFRVYNNHLESYNLSFTSLAEKFSPSYNLTTEEIGSDLLVAHNKLLDRTIKRSNQVNTIAKDIKDCKYPTLICGDFNDTPMSYTYNTLTKGKKDSFKEAGKGFGATFSLLYPLLRIDYILYSPELFSCTNLTIEKIKLSDHYPSFATLIIK